MKKDTLIIIGIILLGICMYGLTLRGAVGNPTSENITSQPTSPFESSHEKGPYGHLVSITEHGTYALTKEWADLASPDVGTYQGRYYAFFAPGVPYLTLPFYIIGKYFGVAQLATFGTESLVSIITLVFLFLIGRRIFALPRWAAFFSVLVYGFASTSWSYAITLYQNSFTACFMVTSFYSAWQYSQSKQRFGFLYAGYVWLAYALAISVDYPNAVLMLPVMVYLAYNIFSFKKIHEGIALSIRWSGIFTCAIFIIVTGFHLWHNNQYYGGWSKVAGTLSNRTELSVSTQLSTSQVIIATSTLSTTSPTALVGDKSISGTFHEKLIPNGIYILLFSDQRGLLYFTPIFIFSFLGIGYALRKKEEERAKFIVPLGFIFLNIFLYTSWGDPWGGWAYGPRYIIPAMASLSLFTGIALYEVRKMFLQKILIYAAFLYSSAVALLGALTTNMVPTKGDALLLPNHADNFLYNITFLQSNKSSSFIYNTYIKGSLTLVDYFIFIYVVIIVLTAIVIFKHHNE